MRLLVTGFLGPFFVAAVVLAQPVRPHILGVAHISILVSDLDRARSFYKGFLGFGEAFSLDRADGSISSAFIKVNDYQYIEITPGLKPGEDRLSGISFYTDDAQRLRAYLASRGVVVPDEVHTSRTGDLTFHFNDPDRHRIEVVQYVPNGRAMLERGRLISDTRISTRIAHVGILVGDGKAAVDFYGGILGFQETLRGSSTGTVLSWINMRVPDGDDGVEFMLYQHEPPMGRRGMEHHLCLETPSIPAALEILGASPYAKGYDRPFEIVIGSNRRRHVNLFDPDGTRTELMEPFTVDGKPAVSSTAPLPH